MHFRFESAYPYASEIVQKHYEVGGALNGQLISERVTTVIDIDDYGTPLEVKTEIFDRQTGSPWQNQVFTTLAKNPAAYVLNDEANWCVGVPQRTEITTTLPDGTSQTRISSQMIDPVSCRATQTIIEPDSSTLRVTTNLSYDSCGNVNSMSVVGSNANGSGMAARTSYLNYGSRCQLPETVTNTLGEVTSIVYNYDFGVPTTVTDPNDIQAQSFYDSFGRLIREEHADGTDTKIDREFCSSSNNYCNSGNANIRLQVAAQERDANDNTINKNVSQLDLSGRTLRSATQQANGYWSFNTTSYDEFGYVFEQSLPHSSSVGGKVRFTYDLMGRRLKEEVINSGGGVDRYSSQAYAGRTVTYYDPNTNVGLHTGTTSKMFDVVGGLRRAIDPSAISGGATYYNSTFTASGRQDSVTDSYGNVSIIDFNPLGLRTSISDPDMGVWTFSNNSLGELVSQTDAKGQVVTFGYDALSRTISRTEVEGTTSFNFGASAANNNIGQLQSVTSPGGYSEAYTYDGIGRPATVSYNLDSSYSVSFSYNNQGLLDTLTYPQSTGSSLKVQHNYSYGVLTQVEDFDTGIEYWTLDHMDVAGRPLSETLGNQVTQLTGYDPLSGHMSARQSGSGGSSTNLADLEYTWDKNGNLETRTDNLQGGLTEEFYYDELNRLDFAELDGLADLDITLNAIGNITYKSGVGAYTYGLPQPGCNYSSHSQPHAVRNAGGISYCYDANGNMTARGGDSIVWTSYNKPSVINTGAYSSQFSYGAFRNRWKQVAEYPTGTETTIYVGGLLEKVTRGGVTEYRHNIATGGDATVVHTRRSNGSSDTYYTNTDHLGSSSVVTDQSGSLIVKQSYDAFGKRRNNSGWSGAPSSGDMNSIASAGRRGHTQHEMLDNVELIHMNGRVYDQTVGRFISADPVVQAPAYSQSYNRYAYTWNNPLNATDPSGFSVPCYAQIPLTGVAAGVVFGSPCPGGGKGVLRDFDPTVTYIDAVAMWYVAQMAAVNYAVGVAAGQFEETAINNHGQNGTYFGAKGGIAGFGSGSNGGSDGRIGRIITTAAVDTINGIGGSTPMGALLQDLFPEVYLLDNPNPTQGIVEGSIAFGVGVILTRGRNAAGKITGYTKHGLNQALGRNGGRGVSAKDIVNAVTNPRKVVEGVNGTMKYQGKKATVILNSEGKVITTYGKSRGPQIWSQGTTRSSGGGSAQRRANEDGFSYNPNLIW